MATHISKEALELIKRDEERAREKLVRTMMGLGEDLVNRAKRLQDNPDYTINSLGEVQGRGPMIDAHCGEFTAIRNLYKDLEGMEDEAQQMKS